MVQYVLSGTAGTRQKENSEQAVKLIMHTEKCFAEICHNLIPEGKTTQCFMVYNLFLFSFAGIACVRME